MGEWGYATFFHTDDLDAVESAIARVCEASGMRGVEYKPRKREQWDAMQYGTGASSDRWSLAVGAGRRGWSIVRSAPFELLAEPTESGEHRLGLVARALGCEALHVSLYDSVAMIVAQASARGEVVLSGYTMEGPTFHGVAIDEARYEPKIDRIELPREVHEALDRYLPDGFEALLAHLADTRWSTVGAALVEGKKIAGARVLSFERATDVELAPPLRVRFAVEDHPLGRRYVLDDAVWVEDGGIDAIDAERGAAFVRKVARWLNVPVELDPCVPLGAFALLAPPADAPRRVGVTSEVLSIGERQGAVLGLHTSPALSYGELEERSPTQRRRLIEILTHALVGRRESADAVYGEFERVFTEPTSHAMGAFAGERVVASWWRRLKSAVLIEGHEVFELDGLCNGIAATPTRVALSLVTPGHVNERSQGYGQDDPTRIVLIDVETRAVREVLRSDEHLRFGFTHLCFRGQTLGVEAARDGAKVIVSLDGERRHEQSGEFGPWAYESVARGVDVEEHYHNYSTPMIWAGPSAVVVNGEPLAVLDLETRRKRALFACRGLTPVACSESGDRCLARTGERRLFIGRRSR